MSDRLWKITATYGPDDAPMMWEEATVDEVLAYVRRGVESGTIKGEVVQASYDDDWLADHDHSLPVSKGGIYVVIGPINGGEDR